MIVEADETEESGQREVLNFGHTVGHAIETYTQNGVSHGRAVAMGMVEEAYMALNLGLLNEQSFKLLVSTLRAFGLPTEMPSGVDRAELVSIMQQDKKVRGGQLVLPVLVELGRTEMRAIDSVY
jgi:3-dehydroquinate synthase